MKLLISNTEHDHLDEGWLPSTVDEFNDFINEASVETLIRFGFSRWKSDDEWGCAYYLYPGIWFNRIPNGTQVYCIDESIMTWEHSKMSNDTRFGCLAYGVIKTESSSLIKIV